MLSKYGCEAIGADYDNQAISVAKIICNQGRFLVADALNLPFTDESFDAVVSFETIEHVLDGSRFFIEMHRILKPGGTFICSTPNIRYTAHPPYHVREYTPEEFYELIQHWFPHIEHYGQYFKPVDWIMDLYRRYIRAKLIIALGKLGFKEMLKNLFCPGNKGSRECFRETYQNELWNERVLTKSNDANYLVRKFTDTKWVRIMIVVAKREVA